MLKNSFIVLLLLLPLFTIAKEPISAFSNSYKSFNHTPSLQNYIKLQEQYKLLNRAKLPEGLYSLATQQLAMVDTLFARYEQAESRLYSAHKGYGDPIKCGLTNFTLSEAIQAITGFTKKYDIVMINESHTRIASRAFIYQLLSKLKQQGFTHLALEALYQVNEKLKDTNLQVRGYPLDSLDYGFYLREPIMAEIIRKAIRLGFVLVPYDYQSSSKRERETLQSSRLASLLLDNPNMKLLIIGGYSHIYKNDDWMGQKLQARVNSPILSINQTSTMTGCLGIVHSKPYVLLQETGKLWSINPDATDLSVIQSNSVNSKTERPNWLSLDNERVPIKLDSAKCNNTWPCLISINYQQESINAVPANLLYLENAESNHWIYLRPDIYQLQFETIDRLIVVKNYKVKTS